MEGGRGGGAPPALIFESFDKPIHSGQNSTVVNAGKLQI